MTNRHYAHEYVDANNLDSGFYYTYLDGLVEGEEVFYREVLGKLNKMQETPLSESEVLHITYGDLRQILCDVKDSLLG